ncbi:hypothetical protein VTH82DRAFT_1844 [Thermothelomyces myriococcoides]
MAQRYQFSPQDQFLRFGLGDGSPESPDSITMRNFEQSASLSMPSFTQYLPIAAQNLDSREFIGGLRYLPKARSQLGFTRNHEGGLHPMSQFFTEPGPWSPFEAAAQPASMIVNLPASFRNYRSAAPPSEPDTINQSVGGPPTDSGYGSNARQSVGIPSVQGEIEPSLITRLNAIGSDEASPRDDSHTREAQVKRPSFGALTSRGNTCPDCGSQVKTRSELKKHEARHNKPWKCSYPNCQKGFGTKNDLDRHMKGVHKHYTSDTTVYRCTLDQCKDKEKDWSRLDNFRQHLKRAHGLEKCNPSEFAIRISESNDVGIHSSETTHPDLPETSSSTPTSEALWAGTSQGHVDPANLLGVSNFDHISYTKPSSSFSPMEEKDAMFPETGSLQLSDRDTTGSPYLLAKPAPSVLDAQQPAVKGVHPRAGSSLEVNQLAFGIAPDLLSQASTASRPFGQNEEQPQQAKMTRPDAPERPEASDAGVVTQTDEAESNEPDVMQVDGSAQDPSTDGAHGSDSEENEPLENSTDSQSDIVRDAGAQHPEVDEAHFKNSPPEVDLDADNPPPNDLDETQADAVLRALIKKGKLGEMLKKYGYLGLDDQETKEGLMHPGPPSTAGNNDKRYKCQDCPKVFNRRCELKKHSKRHAKPYACTFLNCQKKFGSKNDWKRHEKTQHTQAEIWRCAERPTDRPGDGDCGKVCDSRESLQDHLEEDHGIRDTAVLNTRLTEGHMDRNYEVRFWCGFCQKTIEPTSKERPAHSQRFDHIDDHLNGRNGFAKADIESWKHVDAESIKQPTNPQRKSKGAKVRSIILAEKAQKRGHERSGDDDYSRTKRRRHDKTRFWKCCCCGEYWSESTAIRCLKCNHCHCESCDLETVPLFEEEVDPKPKVPIVTRNREDGGFTAMSTANA